MNELGKSTPGASCLKSAARRLDKVEPPAAIREAARINDEIINAEKKAQLNKTKEEIKQTPIPNADEIREFMKKEENREIIDREEMVR